MLTPFNTALVPKDFMMSFTDSVHGKFCFVISPVTAIPPQPGSEHNICEQVEHSYL
jgi:hypothetical protein